MNIKIVQEVTLERQAFDAHMRINNGLTTSSLENVAVTVSFVDENGDPVLASSDPDATDALFFIRLDTMSNINNVAGTGTVAPSTSADIHWLIIPAPGASNGVPSGTLYYVGAKLTYTIGGEENVTEVTPDYIFVKPMPMLTLDYFLTKEVYGDDAFTTEIEPSIPFTLGVRVSNNGLGAARKLKIDSAQPAIVDNEQGLLVNFQLEGSQVNDQPVSAGLLVDFGDIEPAQAAMARWIMISSLSGQFVDFTATYSHADELGGELTSLLEAVNTHSLVRDVLVDLPGRDVIGDFLAEDDDIYRVYESENVDTEVIDLSGSASLTHLNTFGFVADYSLTFSAVPGPVYVKLTDPINGDWLIKEIIRSDGKIIKPENGWLSKTRVGADWEYFVNLFDVETTGTYTVVFMDPSQAPQPPEIQPVGFQWGMEENLLSFTVTALDPNGTTPQLSGRQLPVGAVFSDQGDGSGLFAWTPAVGQAGGYEIAVSASDGTLSSTKSVPFIIYPGGDSDGDGIPDYWETTNFDTLDRDGSGDFDGDGISDLDELHNGTNPANLAPNVPVIMYPAAGDEVESLSPTLTVSESHDPDEDPVTFHFELYADSGMSNLVAAVVNHEETSWTVPDNLNDNSRYWWRVRADDGSARSGWAYGDFFVNTVNDAPGVFGISRPRPGAEVDVLTPVQEVTNSLDVDEDAVSYVFELYADDGVTLLVASDPIPAGETGKTSWTVEIDLVDSANYFWKAVATDEHSLSAETAMVDFFVNTANDAPSAPVISAPAIGAEVDDLTVELVVKNAVDLDEDLLTYDFELDVVKTFDSLSLQTAAGVASGDSETSADFGGLDDNTLYFWRVMASDGLAGSPWTEGRFFVNLVNDDPQSPNSMNPGDGSWSTTLNPKLELFVANDADNDSLSYIFSVYGDSGLTQLLTENVTDSPVWTVPNALADNSWYYWTAEAEDVHGVLSMSSGPWAFFAKDDGVDTPPVIIVLEPAGDITTMSDTLRIGWQDDDPDSNAMITLTYDNGGGAVEIATGVSEDQDGSADTYLWDISSLPDGVYAVSAEIVDNSSQAGSTAPGMVTIARSVTDTVAEGVEVSTTPVEEVSLQFTEVETSGEVTVEKIADPSAPADFMLMGGDAYQIDFNGTFTEKVTVCIHYDETAVIGLEKDLQLLHWNGSEWLDVTTSLDPENNTICGRTDSFSPFLVVEPDIDNDSIPDGVDDCIDVDGDTVCAGDDNCEDIVNLDQTDSDNDGFGDVCDDCPSDPFKTEPGICGCGTDDADTDNDTVADCLDNCVDIANPSQADSDHDGPGDACDGCPDDSNKIVPGICGCGIVDIDTDTDNVADCIDNCPEDYNPDQADSNSNGIGDVCDNQPPELAAVGPFTVNEGGNVEVAATANDPDGDPLIYGWDLDNDGSYETVGQTVLFSAAELDGPAIVMIGVRVIDPGALMDEAVTTVEIVNVAPVAELTNITGTIDESGSATVAFSNQTDASIADTTAGFFYSYDCESDGVFELTDAAVDSFDCEYGDNGIYTVTSVIRDQDFGENVYTTTVTVNNAVTTVAAINATLDPVEVGIAVDASADFNDIGVFDTHTAVWDWGDGSTSEGVVSEADGSGWVDGSHVYSTANVYTVTLTVTDNDGGSGESIFTYVVVYDPGAGFVTGGGWIDSPVNAYLYDPDLTGKANFGFVSRYQNGANIPTGQTQFKFRAADFDFHSTSYQWLIIAGPKAQYKGSGTINGAGDYGFILTATDGQISGGGGIDKFRFKAWDKITEEVIYDNQRGEEDDADAATAIGGGSIVIHQ